MTTVHFAVEGHTDIPIAERLIQLTGLRSQQALVAGGKSRLDPRIPSLNRSGAHLNWLILRDLDHDASCPPQLIRHLLREHRRSPRVALRVPVRTMESWILADVEGFAREFAVSRQHLPRDPDDIQRPRQFLVDSCRRSRRSEIRDAMTPRPGSGRQAGPEYSYRITKFAAGAWDPERASGRSRSLRSTIAALRKLVADRVWT